MYRILLLILFTSSLWAQTSKIGIKLLNDNNKNAKTTTEVLTDHVIKVNVLDENNQVIKDLSKNDFQLTQDNYKATIQKVVPLSQSVKTNLELIFCIDNSASMLGSTEIISELVNTLLDSLPSNTNITAVMFDNSKSADKETYDNKQLNITKVIYGKDKADCKKFYREKYEDGLTNMTYLNDQIYTGLKTAAESDLSNDNIFIFILSDGQDLGSEIESEPIILSQYKKGKIYAIDFGQKLNNKLLSTLAQQSNGKYFNAKDREQLFSSLNVVRDRIVFSGYEITFTSNMPPKLSLNGFYQFKNSQFINTTEIDLKDVNSREYFPLLNYIFFEPGSADLKDKYVSLDNDGFQKFQTSDISNNQLDIYYNILNIVGKRLNENPEATITLSGYNDNTDSEKGNIALSKKRAEVVKNYFVNVCGISEDRITLSSGNLPLKRSNPKTAEGREENRRVEITSNDPQILALVGVVGNTKITKPDALQLKVASSTDHKIVGWKLQVEQDDNILYTEEKTGDLPENISWNISKGLGSQKINDHDLMLKVIAKDDQGYESDAAGGTIKLNYSNETVKKVIESDSTFVEKVNLVLFEFNSSNLDKRNASALEMLREPVGNALSIEVKGFTDSTGPDQINYKLSGERAGNTASSMSSMFGIPKNKIQVEGLGEYAPLYNNNLPEGRIYNRTCQIIVETSVQ